MSGPIFPVSGPIFPWATEWVAYPAMCRDCGTFIGNMMRNVNSKHTVEYLCDECAKQYPIESDESGL